MTPWQVPTAAAGLFYPASPGPILPISAQMRLDALEARLTAAERRLAEAEAKLAALDKP